MDQANPSGWRYSSDITMVVNPAERKIPQTQEAISAWDNPPAAPTARVTAMGPEAEKTRPITPLLA